MCLKIPPVASLCTGEICIIVYGEWDLVFLETLKFREECYVDRWLMESGGSRLTSIEIHNNNIWASLKCRHCKPFWGEIYDGRDTMDEKSMETIWQEGSCDFSFWCRFCRGCVDNHWYYHIGATFFTFFWRIEVQVNNSRWKFKRKYCTTNTPHQNGITERINMTVQEAIRTMLLEAKLEEAFWREEVATSMYTLY